MFGIKLLSTEEKAVLNKQRREFAIQLELNDLSEKIRLLRDKQRVLTAEYDKLRGV